MDWIAAFTFIWFQLRPFIKESFYHARHEDGNPYTVPNLRTLREAVIDQDCAGIRYELALLLACLDLADFVKQGLQSEPRQVLGDVSAVAGQKDKRLPSVQFLIQKPNQVGIDLAPNNKSIVQVDVDGPVQNVMTIAILQSSIHLDAVFRCGISTGILSFS